MNTNIGTRIMLVVGVVVVALLGWGLYASIEFYDDTEETAWSLEALRNPYLAAQQFMQQSGISAVEADSLIGLNSLDGVATVMITDANQVVNPRQLEQVLGWLENGGNLIVTANSIGDSDDLLLEKFSVDVNWRSRTDIEKDGEPESMAEADDEVSEQKRKQPSVSDSLREYNQQIDEGKTPEEITSMNSPKQTLTSIDFGEDIGVVEIAFKTNRVLTHPYSDGEDVADSDPRPFSWSASEYGIHLMQFDVGDGLLTIVSDPTIWTSRRIDQHDHAFLLWILSSKEGNFAILHPTLRDSIWALISKHAPEFLVALGLGVVFWLWHLGHRFGRILPRDDDVGRALSQHFSATAHYLWHRKAGDKLVEPLRQQIFRSASLRLPEFASASRNRARQLELISRHCGLDISTVETALSNPDFNETSLVRTVKLLKYIEQSL